MYLAVLNMRKGQTEKFLRKKESLRNKENCVPEEKEDDKKEI